MISQNEHLKMIEKYSARNYAPLPIVVIEGSGVWLKDINGKKYLDMLSAYSAVSHGHCHPKILQALFDQAQRLTLTSRAFHHDVFGLFCKELTERAGQEMVLLMNTGAEAVETALKAARRWGYRKKGVSANQAEIVVCSNNFHGRTLSVISFSSEKSYQADFGPFTPGFKMIPFGDIQALRQVLTPQSVAFLVEPIQGEGGILVPPVGYFKEVAAVCKQNNVLLMLDEIQTGLGRTGKFFAFQHERIQPDVLILGKALGGGVLPVSAVLASHEVLDLFEPGSHGSTFGGNALACAVGRVALRVLEEEKLVERSQKLGEYFLSRLRSIRSSLIKEVRGQGLLIGIELKPEAGGARKYCEALMNLGILCKETHVNVIRMAPPLVISNEEIDWAFPKIQQILEDHPAS